MLKWLMRKGIAAFERKWDYDASYVRELIDAGYHAEVVCNEYHACSRSLFQISYQL